MLTGNTWLSQNTEVSRPSPVKDAIPMDIRKQSFAAYKCKALQ
jgi:hypothetical protein